MKRLIFDDNHRNSSGFTFFLVLLVVIITLSCQERPKNRDVKDNAAEAIPVIFDTDIGGVNP